MKNQTTFEPRTFGVIGAGPVGCIVAAFLARGGYDVALCDVIPDLVAPAADRGIIIEGAETLTQRVKQTCTSVDELAGMDCDVIFITVKANALPLIVSAIEDFHQEGMVVVSWQNGIDTELEIAGVLGKNASMRAVVNYGCGLAGPAHVKMAFHHPPHFIQELDPVAREAAVAIAGALTRGGLETRHTDQIVSMVWRKSIMNASMNPVCAVTGLTMAQAMNDPIIFNIVDALVKECIQVARANEIPLGWEYYTHAMDYMGHAGDHKPSMLMDIENQRRTEIDFINGKFVEYGDRAGIPTPYNTTLRSLVKGLESRF
ncbi:MAG: 2-dehydropantoate 2-reductase [Deltaproteobacteria bacterium]|nr:2-dehydropantoate 2-reductase [Deltaproteobacteria bacterium]MBW2131076.1 2-dehydropantoate 2-reductase [Deltaproteobacteria bacterium]